MSVAAQREAGRIATADVVEAAARVAAEIGGGRCAVAAFRSAGLLDMSAPAGPRPDPVSILYAIEEVANADGSAGWLLAAAQRSCLLHWAGPEAREQVAPGAFVTGSPRPEGNLVRDGKGYRVSGSWGAVPGAAEADWFALPVWAGDVPTAVLLPAEDVRGGSVPVSIGLESAACQDIHVDGALVPASRVIDPFGPPRTPGTPPFAATGRQAGTAVALGLSRRALHEFASAARHRSRLGSVTRMAEQPLMQKELNRAVQSFRAGRELLLAETARLAESGVALAGASGGTRANLAAAQLHAQRVAHEAVRFAFTKAGGSALYTGHPLEVRWRDSETVAQQWVFGAGTERHVARAQFGDYVPQFVL